MHRDAAAVGAAVAVLLLIPASASAAPPDPATGHATDGEVAEWPEWAAVDGGDEQAPDEHAGHSPEPGLTEPDHTEGHDDHGDEDTHEDEGTHGDEDAVTPDRPRAQVLGSFAAVNGGVLLTAAIWRRRTKGEVARRRSARAAALHGTTGDGQDR